MRKIHFSCNFYSIIKTVGATVLDGLCALAWRNKLALRKKLRNLHAKSQLSSFCSFRDLSVHTDGRKDGQTDMAINPDQEHIYFMGRKRFLLPVTYFPTNLVYPLALRVTGIIIFNIY